MADVFTKVLQRQPLVKHRKVVPNLPGGIRNLAQYVPLLYSVRVGGAVRHELLGVVTSATLSRVCFLIKELRRIWCDRFVLDGIKVSFGGPGTLKIVIPVEN